MTNFSAGDRVRIAVDLDEYMSVALYDGLVCTVLPSGMYSSPGRTLLRPLTPRPYREGITEFYWPSYMLELLPDLTDNIELATHNAYQFEALLLDLKRRRRETYTVEAFAALYGETVAWVADFESSHDPRIWDIKRYAMVLGIQLDIKLSPVR